MSELENKLPELSRAHFIIALSGGADSTLLLRFATEYFRDPERLTAAHVNHMIRGDEALRDENFCIELSHSLGIGIETAHIDVPQIAANSGKSIEEAARDARYEFLEALAEKLKSKYGSVYIMTAHNADDNIETLLINIARGSGLKGLCAIPEIRGIFVRPLLRLTSSEIREYLSANGYSYVVDSTNLSNDYTRNKIRHSVMPVLREINPAIAATCAGMFEALRKDSDYLDECAASALGNFKDAPYCPLDILQAMPKALFARAVMRMYCGVANSNSLERDHIDAIHALAEKGEESSRLALPRNTECYINRSKLCFRQKSSYSDIFPTPLDIPADISTESFTLTARHGDIFGSSATSGENIYKLSIHTTLCSDKIIGRIIVRTRRDGDVIRFGGITRKVKKLLSEKHIPLHIRDRLPILEDEVGILWIPGFPPRDGTKFCGVGSAVTVICNQISTESQDII